MSDRYSTSNLAIGLILGVAAGLAIGFLLAPRPGKDTRGMVKDKATDISEAVRDLTADRKKVYKETWKSRQGLPTVSDAYFE